VPVQGAGTRTDILIEAVERHPISGEVIRSAAVIEIKGTWNPQLFTGLRSQLVDDYLPNLASTAGVYLVGWFPLEQWTVESRGRQRVPRRPAEDVLAELENEASTLRVERGISLAAVVLRIPRPHHL
jgi:hypothetical protein